MGKWNWSIVDDTNKTKNTVFWAILAISSVCLIASFIAENLANLTPCRLCLFQRYTYLGISCLSGLGLFSPKMRYVRHVMIGVLFFGLAIAIYQSLAYAGLVDFKCSLPSKIEAGLTDFKESLQTGSSCSKPLITIFNLPITWANVIIYSGLTYVLLKKDRH